MSHVIQRELVVKLLLRQSFQRCRRLSPWNFGLFCRVKANRASNTLSQRTGKRMCCEQIVLIGFKGSVLLICCLGFGCFRYFYRLWTAFWFELIWKASSPDSPGARSPTTVREAGQRKTVLRRLDVIEKFWSFSHASSILSTRFCVLFRGSGDVSLLRFWSVFAGTKRTWRAKSGHRGLGKNNLTVPKHARNIFCLDFKVASDHMHMHSEGLTSG